MVHSGPQENHGAPENMLILESSSPHCGLCCMRLSISTPLLGNITVVVDWDVSGWLKCCDNSLRRRVYIASLTFRYRFWFFFNLFFYTIWYQWTCGNCSIICFWKYFNSRNLDITKLLATIHGNSEFNTISFCPWQGSNQICTRTTDTQGINQRYLKNWADVVDKICFVRT